MKKKISFAYIIIIGAILPFAVSAAAFEHDLFFGMRNNAEVKLLQEFLHSRGFYNESITGNFFSLTRRAVIDFQKKEGIRPAQGYVGGKTRAKIMMLLNNTVKPSVSPAVPSPSFFPSPSPSAIPSVSPTPLLSPPPLPSAAPIPTSTPTPAPVVELRISGNVTQPFPDIANAPLKLGDITIKNTTDHPILFNQFQLDIYDAMNSSLNRGKTVLFKLREGTTTYDSLISEKQFSINNQPPPTGEESNRRQVNVSFPITVKAGETKVTSLWIENLDYVISGYLRIEMLAAFINDPITLQGGFKFLLTRP